MDAMDSGVESVATGRASSGAHQPAARPAPGPPPSPIDVGLVFAIAAEAGGLVDRLNNVVTTHGARCNVHEGTLAGRHVAVIVASAAGSKAARQATELLIQGHRPRWVISAGFAGGLEVSIEQGTMFLAEEVTNTADVSLQITAPPVSPDRQQRTCQTGRLLSVDRLVRLPQEKRRLGQQYAARAVDMETWTVVDSCLREHVSVLSVRVISDTVADALPEEIERVVRQATTAGRAGAVIGALWRRPSSVKDLWRLQEIALKASDQLAAALEEIVRQLR